MLRLYFNVTEESVKLDTAKDNDCPAAGNINYIECCFNLPSAYDDLVVEAVFNGEKRVLVNGVCSAPYIAKGQCTVGVVAYAIENDSYKLLSSPRPCEIYLPKGSFENIGAVGTQPEPDVLEAYYQRIKALIRSAGGSASLDNGKLRDVVVIRSIEDYDSFMEGAESLLEEMQEGEYILLFILNVDLGSGETVTVISAMVKENDDFVFYDGFNTEIISEQINAAVKPLKKEIEALQPVMNTKADIGFTLEHNTEYRRPDTQIFGTDAWLQLLLPSNIPDDYIASLVFNSGETARIFSYPQEIIFTGDDVTDNVFVPEANKTYNVVFWYDGINVNAVSRGVPYAQE